MGTEHLILIEHFCTNHEIEISVIDAFHDYGLIEILVVDDRRYLSPEQLPEAEKLIRLHLELNINLEGIDVISNLLQRIDGLEQELKTAQNKLRLYED